VDKTGRACNRHGEIKNMYRKGITFGMTYSPWEGLSHIVFKEKNTLEGAKSDKNYVFKCK
jgi:hypothetical protein